MKFKTTKIAAAVAAGLGVSVVGTSVVRADSLLFPYFVTGGSVTTLISVINRTPAATRTAAPANQLHYRYVFKGTDRLDAGCQEFDFFLPSSTNDIITLDVGSVFGDDNSVLFEPNQRVVRYETQAAPFPTDDLKPVIGFLVVDNNTVYPGRNVLDGEAFIVDFTSGSVWGYSAYNPAKIWATDGATLFHMNPYDFSDRVETAGEVLVARPPQANPADYWAPIAIMPFEQVTTRLFVTPIGLWPTELGVNASYQMTGSPRNNRLTARVGLVAGANGQFLMYDRDEETVSASAESAVTCVGRVTLNEIVPRSVQNRIPGGGWSNVAVGSGGNAVVGGAINALITDQAVVIKLEFNPLRDATLDGQPLNGTFNNSIWLTKGIRESITIDPRTGARPLPFSPSSRWFPTFDIPVLGENSTPFPLMNTAALAGVPVTDLQRLPIGREITPLNVEADAAGFGDFYSRLLNPASGLASQLTPAQINAILAAGRVEESTFQ